MKSTIGIIQDRACCVVGCPEIGVCFDDKNYTKQRVGESFVEGYADLEIKELADDRELWYCGEHAKSYLFPIIDLETGNTAYDIVGDFMREGLW